MRAGDSIEFEADSVFQVDSSFAQEMFSKIITSGLFESAALNFSSSQKYILQGIFNFKLVKLTKNCVRLMISLSKTSFFGHETKLQWGFDLLSFNLPITNLDTLKKIYDSGPEIKNFGINFNSENIIIRKAMEVGNERIKSEVKKYRSKIPEPINLVAEVIFDPARQVKSFVQDHIGAKVFGGVNLFEFKLSELKENILVMDYVFDLKSPRARKAYNSVFSPSLLSMDFQALLPEKTVVPEKLLLLQDTELIQTILNEDKDKSSSDQRITRYMAWLEHQKEESSLSVDFLLLAISENMDYERKYLTILDNQNRRNVIRYDSSAINMRKNYLFGQLDYEYDSRIEGFFLCYPNRKIMSAVGFEVNIQMKAEKIESSRQRIKTFLLYNLSTKDSAILTSDFFSSQEPISLEYNFYLTQQGIEALSTPTLFTDLEKEYKAFLYTRVSAIQRPHIEDLFIDRKGMSGYLDGNGSIALMQK